MTAIAEYQRTRHFDRAPAHVQRLMLLPTLANLVDAMDGKPFRFYRQSGIAGRICWIAESA